jgi:outer membrane protein assembly factor BamA
MPRLGIFVTSVVASLGGVLLAGSARAQNTQAERREIDGVPIAGGDSDIGFGAGAVGAITQFDASDQHRWVWRLEGAAFLTVRGSPSFDFPYQDHWLQLTIPGLLGGRLRLQTRIAYTQQNNINYFGLGNGVPTPPDSGSTFFQYGRTHPEMEAYARVALGAHYYAVAGGALTLNFFDIAPDSKLALDMKFGSPEVQSLLDHAPTDAVVIVGESLGYDSRDDEVVPRSGFWHEVTLRLSPSIGSFMPYAYGEVLGIARAYVPLGPRFVFAARGLADVLFGAPPFYQLAQYLDTYAIGGISGVRGIPGPRYYGKIKILGNFELRGDIAGFSLFGKSWKVGAVGFFDAGRVWADWSSQPELDGTGLGIHWGTGGGIRVQQGTSFVIRGDFGWSPVSQAVLGYFGVGETF